MKAIFNGANYKPLAGQLALNDHVCGTDFQAKGLYQLWMLLTVSIGGCSVVCSLPLCHVAASTQAE